MHMLCTRSKDSLWELLLSSNQENSFPTSLVLGLYLCTLPSLSLVLAQPASEMHRRPPEKASGTPMGLGQSIYTRQVKADKRVTCIFLSLSSFSAKFFTSPFCGVCVCVCKSTHTQPLPLLGLTIPTCSVKKEGCDPALVRPSSLFCIPSPPSSNLSLSPQQM